MVAPPEPRTENQKPGSEAPSARDIVTRRIEDQCHRFPQLDINPLDVSGLDRRDAALAQAIDHEVMRRWLTLVAMIRSRLSRDWQELEARVQAGLLVGTAQIFLFDRLPEHAVIDAAVGWTRQRAGKGAAGLVNAVLRRMAELRDELIEATLRPERNQLPRGDGRTWRLHKEVFSDDAVTQMAQQTSHPEYLLRRWAHEHGAQTASKLAMHSLVQPPILVTNTESDNWGEPHDVDGFVVYQGAPADLAGCLGRDAQARVQDPAAAAAVEGTRQLNPNVIIDVCAGRGTKTRQLESTHPQARIVATDIDNDRRTVLRRTFKSSDRVDIIAPDRLRDHVGRADLLLLDVPCSNTGALARRVEAKYRFDADSLEQLTGLQRQLLADSIPLLAQDGHLLYSTCSLEAEENQQQVEWLSHWHRMRSVWTRSTLPQGGPGDPPSSYSDGSFCALMKA
jgi:16S rRNA (cytosine967-C5)-methyltransferase